ncbi:kynurenine--oxoglutarate transaminase 3 [Plakobranchus ocellatus]|uniref:Kynurenine--oxoglutarate transaminase 3 n=1 Tax=Plakobranchus ocellatus TaxID=259542 RepID=A0AAV3Z1C7_9GAST|nr:kynurenine--oxoglutarate transaminase 3 [Plakobranchus ocellatus]
MAHLRDMRTSTTTKKCASLRVSKKVGSAKAAPRGAVVGRVGERHNLGQLYIYRMLKGQLSCRSAVRLGRQIHSSCPQVQRSNRLPGHLQNFCGCREDNRSSLLSLGVSRKMSTKFGLAKRLVGTEKNIWVDISKMAVAHNATNLGQGFPDFMAPDHVVQSIKDAVADTNPSVHQYARSSGLPRLVQTLSKLYTPHLGRAVDPMTEVLVSVGAYGALYCCIQGLVNPGDEVIIIEPFFDCYQPMVTVAGGIPVFVPLRPTKEGEVTSSADWKLDSAELASKFNSKTKLIIFNTPNNPLGKVFSLEEMTEIADLCKKHDVVCISDEVYEWMTYGENVKHIKIATLPGMWDRTITIGSAGKTFSVTGWKLGWSLGPASLINCAQVVHQNCTYTAPTPIQEAVARGLELEISRVGTPESYLTSLAQELLPKRDNLAHVLAGLGMKPVVPDGGYFMMADYSNIDVDLPDTDEAKDFRFVEWLIKNKKLAVIPPTAFYSAEHKHLGENYIRFCFIKVRMVNHL